MRASDFSKAHNESDTVMHAFDPSHQEAEAEAVAGKFLSWKPAGSTKRIPDSQGATVLKN